MPVNNKAAKIVSRLDFLWLAFFLLAIFCLNSQAADQTDTVEEPDLQIEVIIFSQQDFYKAEQPRRDVKLAFEKPWRLLENPNQEETPVPETQLEPAIPENCVLDENRFEQFTTGLAETAPATLPSLEDELAETDLAAEEQSADQELNTEDVDPVPEIEPSYQILDKDQRQLNPDAYTLNRSPGYRVLFHQAWRQPAYSENQSPWIIVADGDQYDKRHELEGSIRLYLSRFPHFQANIWKTRFVQRMPEFFKPEVNKTESQISETGEVVVKAESWPELPEFPRLEIPEEPPSEACPPGYVLVEPEVELADPLSPLDPAQPFAAGNEVKGNAVEETNIEDAEIEPQLVPDTIWTLNQSVRLEYDKPAYLDHPTMGILVLLSEYEPEVPETDEEPEENPQSATNS